MNDFTISPELLQKCKAIVEVSHHEQGFGGLPAKITNRDSMVALALVPGLLQVMAGGSAVFKLRVACWIAALLLSALSWFWSLWLLLGLLAVMILERSLAKSERNTWFFLAAVLLSLEMVADDFAGWGKACPREQVDARSILNGMPRQWLDYYLPRRRELSREILDGLGPSDRGPTIEKTVRAL